MDEKAQMCVAKDNLLPPLEGDYLSKCHPVNSNFKKST